MTAPPSSSEPLAGRHVLILNWRDERHPEAGGSEVYVGQMARGLAERGAHVTMLCPRYPGAVTSERLDGVDYVRAGGRLSIYLLAPLRALLRRLPRHDVVVEIQNGMPFLAAAYLRTPVTVVVHHVHKEQWPILFSPAMARLGWWLESRAAPRVARRSPYVTVSEATRDELTELGVRREAVSVIRNGSPRLPEVAVGPRSETPEVVVLGRLVPHKRVELAVEAVHALRRDLPDLRLTIVGEGWWHHHLTERVAELGMADAVTFTGHVSEDEKHRLLARAWVSALPSVKEGWGLAVVEAGLHQTPVVAFRSAGGVRESLVDGETGLLADDLAGFTAALGRLLRDDALRTQMGKAAEEHAASFTWEASQQAFADHLAGQLAQRTHS
ncbi:glycosyltransferase family 4 protein [Nocardioides sp.]|uniref:glycosyltransferase family 4 protein n=1 Tax=Nocardioides sp. TaxID=35761 RepID=UPI0035289115